MLEVFRIAFRESFQCAIVLTLLIGYLSGGDRERYVRSLVLGVLLAFLLGFSAGYVPFVNRHLLKNETWTFWRFVWESALFYLGIVFLVWKPSPSRLVTLSGLFSLGFLLFFFEARAVGFLIHDIGAMKGGPNEALAMGVAGTLCGFSPLVAARKYLARIPLGEAFSLPSLLMLIGALQFILGGVGELEKESITISLQRGLLDFLNGASKQMQSALLLSEHSFLKVPLSGVAHFLAGDRTAMTLAILFIMTPPLFILFNVFSRPDPFVADIRVGAVRRYKVAFFRKELMYRAMPVLTAFSLLIIQLHAVNASFNPMYEPVPVPVREVENEGVIRIPFSDRTGDLSDKKLRKYVYYYGNKQIVFLAILKPDGSVGVAMDECEICRPAEWNKDARGYAQRGETLVCKYCMTPIAVPTVNNPGGCNPIPLPFRVEDKSIVISIGDLVDTFKKVQALEKKGTHL